MTVRRTYYCEECEHEFTVDQGMDDPAPPCPNPDCGKILEWRPKSFAIGGSTLGKAAALTQKIMEEDYGFSNFRDNAKEGESAVIPHHETKAETHIVNQTVSEITQQISPEQKQAFWGQNAGAGTGVASMTGQSLIQMAKVGPQGGTDPIAMLHSGVKSGRIPTPKQMMKIEAKVPLVK